jgi:hypothetical protein
MNRLTQTPFIISEHNHLTFDQDLIDEFIKRKRQADPNFTLGVQFRQIKMRDNYRSDQTLIDLLIERQLVNYPYSIELVDNKHIEYMTIVEDDRFEYIKINHSQFMIDTINAILTSSASDKDKLLRIQDAIATKPEIKSYVPHC